MTTLSDLLFIAKKITVNNVGIKMRNDHKHVCRRVVAPGLSPTGRPYAFLSNHEAFPLIAIHFKGRRYCLSTNKSLRLRNSGRTTTYYRPIGLTAYRFASDTPTRGRRHSTSITVASPRRYGLPRPRAVCAHTHRFFPHDIDPQSDGEKICRGLHTIARSPPSVAATTVPNRAVSENQCWE